MAKVRVDKKKKKTREELKAPKTKKYDGKKYTYVKGSGSKTNHTLSKEQASKMADKTYKDKPVKEGTPAGTHSSYYSQADKPETEPYGYKLKTSVSEQFGEGFPSTYTGMEGWGSSDATKMSSETGKGLENVGKEEKWNPSSRSTESELKAKSKKGKEATKKHKKAQRKSKNVRVKKKKVRY